MEEEPFKREQINCVNSESGEEKEKTKTKKKEIKRRRRRKNICRLFINCIFRVETN